MKRRGPFLMITKAFIISMKALESTKPSHFRRSRLSNTGYILALDMDFSYVLLLFSLQICLMTAHGMHCFGWDH